MQASHRKSLSDLFSLNGRVALITGGAQGIGLANAERFAEAGAAVIVADLNATAAEENAGAISERFGASAFSVAVDVTQSEQVEAAARLAVSKFGGLDIWVNNAGIYPMFDPVLVKTGEFESVLRVNVLGVQHGMAAAVQMMTQLKRRGVIINIASTAAFRGSGPYSGSKWAVRGLTEGLAPVVGPRGIRVVALAPSITETPGMTALRASGSDELVARVVARNPMGRLGQPDDVACAAVFLASDAASFITGTTLVVDGGSMTAL
jgi:NAD(P)-dependent dehydrogenase (short-subunit alcohol dehydrogenase family)